MAIEYSEGKTTVSARRKVVIAGLSGLIVCLITGLLYSWRTAPLLGWNTAAAIYCIWTWLTVWPMNQAATASHAVREDPSRSVADGAVLLASVASLAAVVFVLVGAGDARGASKLLQIALGVISVVVAWAVVHTLFALHYAELYYRDKPGGVDFPGGRQPVYKDFAYLAFTIGMTFQVSDTGFENTEFRVAALRHSLISYLFGTVIVATTINLIAGFTK